MTESSANKTAAYHLAQLNIAHLIDAIDSPKMADFVSELDRINSLAESSDGFIWRFQSENGNATEAEHGFGPDYIVNLSVWSSVDHLFAFTYQTAHTEIMSQRKKWFSHMSDAYQVLWWVPAGHHPTEQEARQKLEHLRSNGATEQAFTFKQRFDQPHTVG